MINTLLFDFFGTLVDYSVYRTESGFEETLEYLNRNGVSVDSDRFLDTIENAFETLDIWSGKHHKEYSMQDVCALLFELLEHPLYSEDLVEGLIEIYIEEWSIGVKPIPQVGAFIERLSSRFKLGVVSNTHHLPLVPAELLKMGINDYFEVIITSIEHGQPKPHHSIYQSALTSLDAEPQRTLFVGDSYQADFVGPRNLGMHAVLISEDPPADVPVELVVKSVLEIERLLLSPDFSGIKTK